MMPDAFSKMIAITKNHLHKKIDTPQAHIREASPLEGEALQKFKKASPLEDKALQKFEKASPLEGEALQKFKKAFIKYK